MNKDVIKGKWTEIKGKLKQQWGEFTDDDILQMKGSEEELSGALQKKYGYEKDKASNEIDKFLERMNLKDKD